MDQLARVCRPNVNPSVEGARREQFAVRTEAHRIHRLVVLRQSVQTGAAFDVPESNSRIKARRSQEQILVWKRRVASCWRPLDSVYFALMSAEIVDVSLGVEAPQLQGFVV